MLLFKIQPDRNDKGDFFFFLTFDKADPAGILMPELPEPIDLIFDLEPAFLSAPSAKAFTCRWYWRNRGDGRNLSAEDFLPKVRLTKGCRTQHAAAIWPHISRCRDFDTIEVGLAKV